MLDFNWNNDIIITKNNYRENHDSMDNSSDNHHKHHLHQDSGSSVFVIFYTTFIHIPVSPDSGHIYIFKSMNNPLQQASAFPKIKNFIS